MRGTATNWDLVEDPRVKRAVRDAAKSIANMNAGIVEAEDMYQEGLLLVAGTEKIAGNARNEDFGLVYKEVRERLFKKFIRSLDRSGELDARKYRTITHEDVEEESAPVATFDDGSGDYTEDAVRLLLPAVWDESYAWTLPERDDAPDKDMPKSKGNKSHGNSHWAYIADVKTGWEKSPLTRLERRALLMAFGLAWTHDDIAEHEGVAQPTVTVRINTAIKKITARLNGAHIIEEE